MNKQVMTVVAILAVVTIAGCGKGEHKAGGQVLAKVNDKEITVSQLNFAMQRLGPVKDAEQGKEAARGMLNTLVEQELAYQKALDEKVDRDPVVVQAIEAARRQIISQAFMERQMKAAKPTDDDIHAYYNEHPDLFAKRKVFRLNEGIAVPGPEQMAALKDELAQQDLSFPVLLKWLKEHQIQFRGNTVDRGAEQVSADTLARLLKMKPGDLGYIYSPDAKSVAVFEMVAVGEQPVKEADVKPAIERMLEMRKRVELAQAELKRLKGNAKIDYFGEFEKSMTAQAASAKAPEKHVDKAAGSAEAKSMDKGLSGL